MRERAVPEDVITLAVPDVPGMTETVRITRLDARTMRLEETPLFLWNAEVDEEPSVRWGDVVEVEPGEREDRVVRVLRRMPVTTYTMTVAPNAVIDALCARLVSEGGMWERVFGSLLILHVPDTCSDEVETALTEVLATSSDEESR
ncbi:MAG: hypothetical protein AB2A00_23880 [Myxococcota bacterium]